MAVLFRKAPGEPQKRRWRKKHNTNESFATKDAHAASRNFAKKTKKNWWKKSIFERHFETPSIGPGNVF
jgi:hypothetical protein